MIDSSSSTGGHLVTKFSNLISLVNSRGDTKGIALYNIKTGKLEKNHSYFGSEYKFPESIEIQPPAIGDTETRRNWWFHKYTTFTGISDGLNEYVIAFHFVCDDFLIFLYVLIAIGGLNLSIIIILEKDLQKQLMDTLLSSFIGTVHELDGFLALAHKICKIMNKFVDDNFIQDPRIKKLTKTFMKSSPLVEVLKQDLLDINKKNVIKDYKLLQLNNVYSDFKEFYNKDTSHVVLKEDLQSRKEIRGDYNGLLSVVSNLMSNAFKFSSGHKIVIVKTWDDDKYACFSVSTSGPPLNKLQKEKIFEAFHRLTGENGSGLGLWIVDRHVKAHNGIKSVESENGFNTFTVRFPISNLATIKPKNNTLKPKLIDEIVVKKGSPFKVLLLDDQFHVMDFVEDNLSDLDYTIDYYPNTFALRESINSGLKIDHDMLLIDRYIEGGNDILNSDFLDKMPELLNYKGPLCLFTSAVPNDLPAPFDFAIHKKRDFSHFIKII